MLKQKLEEAAITLKSNNETISYLNKQLTEAQKFSFRALLNNKPQTTVVANLRAASHSQERSNSACSNSRMNRNLNVRESLD
jgi:hypothetical protein